MDIVTILRDLWRLRAIVGIVAVVALLAALAVTYRASFPPERRGDQVGVATTRVLVDTPSSQVVDVSPRGSDTLGARANLIASLMVDGVIKAAIARRAGLPPDQLVAISQNDGVDAQAGSPPPERGVNVLKTRVVPDLDGDQLPIIEINAQASDATGAAKLADAAVAGLRDYLDSRAAEEQVPDARRIRVSGLGAAQASEVTRGPSSVFAFAVAVFVFATGCALILGGAALRRTMALERSWALRMPEDNHAGDHDDAVAHMGGTRR